MKKAFLVAAVGVLCFSVGLVGTYFALPVVAPNAVEQSVPADSASTAAPPDQPASPEPNQTEPTPSDSATASPDESLASFDAVNEVLRDSLQMMRDSMHTLASTSQTLERDVQELRDQVEALQAKRTKAADLAKTLTRLEDEELQAVLGELKMETHAILYEEATGRNRTRILQALPPDQAARLVNRMIASED